MLDKFVFDNEIYQVLIRKVTRKKQKTLTTFVGVRVFSYRQNQRIICKVGSFQPICLLLILLKQCKFRCHGSSIRYR